MNMDKTMAIVMTFTILVALGAIYYVLYCIIEEKKEKNPNIVEEWNIYAFKKIFELIKILPHFSFEIIKISFVLIFMYGLYQCNNTNEDNEKKQSVSSNVVIKNVNSKAKEVENNKIVAENIYKTTRLKLEDMGLSCGLEQSGGSYMLECRGPNSLAIINSENGKIKNILYKMNIYEHQLNISDAIKKGKQIIALETDEKNLKKVQNWFLNCGDEPGYGKVLKIEDRTFNCSLSGGEFSFTSYKKKAGN